MKKKLLYVVVIILLFLLTLFSHSCSDKTNNNSIDENILYEQIYEDISPQEANALIQENRNNTDFVILDVRTSGEYAEVRIENSLNIDFYSSSFEDSLAVLDKNKTYLLYCRSGNRSGQTFTKMKSMEFSRLYNMLGGILRWIEEELPVVE